MRVPTLVNLNEVTQEALKKCVLMREQGSGTRSY
jgi:hypothetical protein